MQCLLINFTEAFRRIYHALLLIMLAEYGLEQNVIDWIVSFQAMKRRALKLAPTSLELMQ